MALPGPDASEPTMATDSGDTRAGAKEPPSLEFDIEAFTASMFQRLGVMVDARMAAILERLPPEQPGAFRPPLKASGGGGAYPPLPKPRGNLAVWSASQGGTKTSPPAQPAKSRSGGPGSSGAGAGKKPSSSEAAPNPRTPAPKNPKWKSLKKAEGKTGGGGPVVPGPQKKPPPPPKAGRKRRRSLEGTQ